MPTALTRLSTSVFRIASSLLLCRKGQSSSFIVPLCCRDFLCFANLLCSLFGEFSLLLD